MYFGKDSNNGRNNDKKVRLVDLILKILVQRVNLWIWNVQQRVKAWRCGLKTKWKTVVTHQEKSYPVCGGGLDVEGRKLSVWTISN